MPLANVTIWSHSIGDHFNVHGLCAIHDRYKCTHDPNQENCAFNMDAMHAELVEKTLGWICHMTPNARRVSYVVRKRSLGNT